MADDVTKVEGVGSSGGAAQSSGEQTGTTNGNEGQEPAKVKHEKIDFAIADAQYRNDEGAVVPAVNGDGLLIAVPKPIRDEDKKVLYVGFNDRKHKPLKKEHFAGTVEFMLFQAFLSRVKAGRLIKGAEQKEAKAKNLLKFGDDVTRKKVNKLAKMREAIESLQKQLEEEGVDVGELD